MTFFNKNNSMSATSCHDKDYNDFVNKDIPIPKSTPCNKSSPNDTSSPCVYRHISSSESSQSVSSHESLQEDNNNNISNPCKEKSNSKMEVQMLQK